MFEADRHVYNVYIKGMPHEIDNQRYDVCTAVDDNKCAAVVGNQHYVPRFDSLLYVLYLKFGRKLLRFENLNKYTTNSVILGSEADEPQMPYTQGIQQLLAAEKRAAEKVNEARILIEALNSRLPLLSQCLHVKGTKTMASHQTRGIQQLLAAEKRAAEKVAEARIRKVKRIKQARDEAQAEIEAYRREKERQFREYEARYMGSKEDVAAKIDKDTEVYLQNMEKMVRENKDQVIEELIAFCVDVAPKAHPNYFIMRTFKKI